jgi:hypothetical protein
MTFPNQKVEQMSVISTVLRLILRTRIESVKLTKRRVSLYR